MIRTGSFMLSIFFICLLVSGTLSIFSQNAIGATKPNFPNTGIGIVCSAAWDAITKLREKSDKQQGVLSAENQKGLDDAVSKYNRLCRDVFGGNLRLATETGDKNCVVGGVEQPNGDADNNSVGAPIDNGEVLKEKIPKFTKSLNSTNILDTNQTNR